MKILDRKLSLKIIIPIICYVFFYGLHLFEKDSGSYYSYFFLYLGLYTSSHLLPNWIIFKQIKILIAIPAVLILLLGPLMQVFFFIIYALIVPFSIIALIYKIVPEYVFGVDLNYSTKLYLILVTGTITTTLFVEKIMLKVNQGLNYDKPEKRQKSQMELALTLVNTERIRFIIYTLFFCYLVIFSLSKLADFEIFTIPKINLSIFYSFVTFIAFERIIHNLKLMKFRPRTFLIKLFNTWEKHDYFKHDDDKNPVDNKKPHKPKDL